MPAVSARASAMAAAASGIAGFGIGEGCSEVF